MDSKFNMPLAVNLWICKQLKTYLTSLSADRFISETVMSSNVAHSPTTRKTIFILRSLQWGGENGGKKKSWCALQIDRFLWSHIDEYTFFRRMFARWGQSLWMLPLIFGCLGGWFISAAEHFHLITKMCGSNKLLAKWWIMDELATLHFILLITELTQKCMIVFSCSNRQ